jgi:hypothetical protein
MARSEISFRQQLFVRQQRRRPRNVQILGEGPRRGEARARRKNSVKDLAADPSIDLLLQAFARPSVDPNEKAGSGWTREMVAWSERHMGLNDSGLHQWT